VGVVFETQCSSIPPVVQALHAMSTTIHGLECRALSGNFTVSVEWSPCVNCIQTVVTINSYKCTVDQEL